MTETTHQPGERVGRGSVSVARTGQRTYEGKNERGDTVLIGPTDAAGHFTPGELFKLALAGCAGMSSDSVATRRLGDDYRATFWVHGMADTSEERYRSLDEEVVLDLSHLTPAERDTLLTLMERSIERSCTIARSIQDSVDITTTIDGTSVN